MNLNLRAAFMVSQAVAQTMIARGNGGSIVHMSSQMGHVGAPKRTVYSASKHAIEGLTKAMAWDLAAHEIRVNAVAPTFIETPMTRSFLDDKAFVEDTLSRIALGRFGQPEDVAAAVVYLASPASDMVTGDQPAGRRRLDGALEPSILGRDPWNFSIRVSPLP